MGGVRDWFRAAVGFVGWLGEERPGGEPTAELVLPRRELPPVGGQDPAAERVAELTDLRTETATFYELDDGRVEAEVAAAPVRYRDAEGVLHPIDTTVVDSSRDGMAFENVTNTFASYFGATSERLATFELDAGSVTVGLPGENRRLGPTAAGTRWSMRMRPGREWMSATR